LGSKQAELSLEAKQREKSLPNCIYKNMQRKFLMNCSIRQLMGQKNPKNNTAKMSQ
jgi:hypothetical protein